ncbi:MFS transporter [Nocardiopsis algeriensis]|uniref:UMF1 family MFS transporter n=1 Tax=Nocardiopsis algeriensis TaxID=1478215 RepID=A0A841INU2_9ACTN|nr:MFS transporter [Nocardiopsis algeriensis]MBB6119850.1 UMF1 family MFS transporter [Nocardiopsis algeriensis]
MESSAGPAAGGAPSADPAERRREQRGWYVYDWANSVFMTSVVTVLIGPYLSGLACASAGAPDAASCLDPSLVLDVPGLGFLNLHPNSLYPALTTAAILLQIIGLPVVGAMADHSRHKKRWLLAFALGGSLCTAGLYLASDGYLAASVLFVLANLLYGFSIVVYNAFLPEISTADERDRVSVTGWGLGYLGGALLLAAHLVLVTSADSLGLTTGEAVRIAFASCAVWWAGFTVLAVRPLRDRYGALAARGRSGPGAAMRQFGRTVKDMRHHPDSLMFLLAFIFFNDGIQATIRYAAPFATQDLGLEQGALITTILVIQFVAFAGAFATGAVARRLGTKRTVLASIAVWIGLVGTAWFLPAGNVGMFIALGVGIGLVLGGTQSLARSMFSLLIPRGREAEYFSLFQISDKGSTFLGSLTVTVVVSLTGGYRMAVVSLIAFFVLGGVLLWRVRMRRGILAVGNEVPERL